jgi:hypothetical protein
VSGSVRWQFEKAVRDEPVRPKTHDEPGFTMKGKVVGYALASRMNNEGGCRPGIERLMADTGLGETAVRGGVAELEAAGLLHVTNGGGRASGGGGQTNLFQAVQPLATRTVARPNPSPHEPNPSPDEALTPREANPKTLDLEDQDLKTNDDYVVVDDGLVEVTDENGQPVEATLEHDDHTFETLIDPLGPASPAQRERWRTAYDEAPETFQRLLDDAIHRGHRPAAVFDSLIRGGAHRNPNRSRRGLTPDEIRQMGRELSAEGDGDERILTPEEIEKFGVA